MNLGWPRTGSTPTPRARRSSSRTRATRRARRSPSCVTSSAASRPADPPRSRPRARARARSPAAGRSRSSSRASSPDGLRLPDAVERAAYFVVAEAVANVAKHAAGSASRVEVRCRLEPGRLVVEIEDDGPGGARIAADPAAWPASSAGSRRSMGPSPSRAPPAVRPSSGHRSRSLPRRPPHPRRRRRLRTPGRRAPPARGGGRARNRAARACRRCC